MPVAKDISGQTFGRLTAIRPTGGKTVHGRLWHCSCSCGGTAIAVASRLITLHTRSCGCLAKEASHKPTNLKHGHTTNAKRATASEYNIWCTMKQRCLNPSSANYSRYGGRGITIDPEWLTDDGYMAFYRDMGPRPSKAHSLDRRDPNGPYSKANCRWATVVEQQNNRSGTRQITYNGETCTSAEWSRRTGIPANAIRNRLDAGWSVARALETKKRQQR